MLRARSTRARQLSWCLFAWCEQAAKLAALFADKVGVKEMEQATEMMAELDTRLSQELAKRDAQVQRTTPSSVVLFCVLLRGCVCRVQLYAPSTLRRWRRSSSSQNSSAVRRWKQCSRQSRRKLTACGSRGSRTACKQCRLCTPAPVPLVHPAQRKSLDSSHSRRARRHVFSSFVGGEMSRG